MEEVIRNYRELMNKIFIAILLLFFGLLMIECKNLPKGEDNEKEEVLGQQESSFISKNTVQETYPDTTINKKMFLTDYYSTEEFYPKYKNLSYNDVIEYSHPFILFTNHNATQYLIAYTYSGSTKNAFDCFEIGYWKDDKKLSKLKSFKTYESDFGTESGIKLGMPLDSLIMIKGVNYKIQEIENDTFLTYEITDYEHSFFLKRYNMPSYFMKYKIQNNIVQHIIFGFDYP